LYYITAKGSLGENIFIDEKDYKMYLELLKKYKEQYGFKLFSFALMPNQLSLLIELKEGETVSMVMHDINSSYTKYYNGRYSREGHLFRERFKSVVVEKDAYLLNLINYIHLRPVKLGLAKDTLEYSFTSNLSYLYNIPDLNPTEQENLSKTIVVDLSAEVREVCDLVAKLFPEKKNYADFISGVTKEEMDELSKKLSRGGILGSRKFEDYIQEEVDKKEVVVPEKRNSINVAISLSIVILFAGTVVGVIYLQKPKVEKVIVKEKIVKEPVEKVLAKLDGTQWIVELVTGEGIDSTYPHFDKLIFSQGTVVSNYFLSKGFVASNYSLSIKDDKTITWETMQRNEAGEIVFWRGEEKEGNMKGTFSRRYLNGTTDALTFTSPGYYKIK